MLDILYIFLCSHPASLGNFYFKMEENEAQTLEDGRVIQVGNVVCRIGKENQVLAEMKNCETVVKTEKAAT